MREICVFLAPNVYDSNSHLVDSLQKNEIRVERFDISKEKSYGSAIAKHQNILKREIGRTYTSPCLCIAFEDSRLGVMAAARAGLTVIGIGQTNLDVDQLKSWGAQEAALNVSDLLDAFGIRNAYQIQYLPYAIQLRKKAESKVGYPVSMLDTLRGSIIKRGSVVFADTRRSIMSGEEEEQEEEEEEEKKENGDYYDNEMYEDDVYYDGAVELGPSKQRLIPREVLGIKPGSLADVYINNLGMPNDRIPTFTLDCHELERDIIRMFGKLYGVKNMAGFVTSGGTEGNFSSLWWQRDYLKDETSGQRPIMLTSNQTHYSVSKAAQQLDLDGRLVQTTSTGEIDCEDLARILDDITANESNRPILMQVNLGTTQTGALDNLPTIHELLVEKVRNRGGMFSIHVDGALMGGILPLIHPFGPNSNIFSDYEVKTVAISGHKFFGSVCICGVTLTTKPFLDSCFERKETGVKYLTGVHDMTPSGSRSGYNVLSFHNTLCGLYMHTDASRLREVVSQCYRNVQYFINGVTKLIGPNQVLHAKHSLTVCIMPRPSPGIMEKYCLMPVNLEGDDGDEQCYAGVCILANIDKAQINRFLRDYARDLVVKKRETCK